MIVLDASALVELLLNTPAGQAVAARVSDPALSLHVPHIADVEVVEALRQYVDGGAIDAEEAASAMANLHVLDLERHAHEPLLERMWELRRHLSAPDAAYLALAEVLGAVVLTCDSRLPRVPGPTSRVMLVTTSA